MRLRLPLSAIPALLVLVLAACGPGGGGDKGPTAVPATPADAMAIHSIDFAQVAALTALQAQTGGEIDTRSVLYADLTGDGRDDAVVPIASGGTLGNLAFLVLTMKGGNPTAILTAVRDRASPGGIAMSIEDGKLVKTIGKYGPEDPRCCPSVLVKTTYRWDGSALQVESEREVSQPSGKQ